MEIQDRVFEVHPEVLFWALAEKPMIRPKDHLAGCLEQKGWLEGALGVALPSGKQGLLGQVHKRAGLWPRDDEGAWQALPPFRHDTSMDAEQEIYSRLRQCRRFPPREVIVMCLDLRGPCAEPQTKLDRTKGHSLALNILHI
jgi:hypothetical protein